MGCDFVEGIGVIVTLIGLIKWFHQYDDTLLGIGAIINVLTIIQWWRDEPEKKHIKDYKKKQ